MIKITSLLLLVISAQAAEHHSLSAQATKPKPASRKPNTVITPARKALPGTTLVSPIYQNDQIRRAYSPSREEICVQSKLEKDPIGLYLSEKRSVVAGVAKARSEQDILDFVVTHSTFDYESIDRRTHYAMALTRAWHQCKH